MPLGADPPAVRPIANGVSRNGDRELVVRAVPPREEAEVRARARAAGSDTQSHPALFGP